MNSSNIDIKQTGKNCLLSTVKALLLMTLALSSCVRQPSQPVEKEPPPVTPLANGAYVICEGIWKSDNASIDRYNFMTGRVINNYFVAANPDWKTIGDVANDIARLGDTAFVPVSGSDFIEIFSLTTGKHIGKIILKPNSAPRRIYIMNRSRAFVTNLYDNSITEFNPITFSITHDRIPVGPAPEAIVGYNSYIFAANSGLGDYWYTKPGAGTISVIDAGSNSEIKKLNAGIDPVELIMNSKTGRLYAAYYNLPSKSDSAGGIVEYDASSLKETRRVVLPGFDLTKFALSYSGDTLFFLNKQGVAFFDLTKPQLNPEQLISNPKDNEFWTALAYSAWDNTLFIGNSRNFQVKGEVIIYNLASPPILVKRFECGINPNTILFF
jgi:DNA-binding beta-propeller fold protein YncE